MAINTRDDILHSRPASTPEASPRLELVSRGDRLPGPDNKASSARTPSPTRPASTRMACSSTPRPTRSCVPRTWACSDSLVLGKHSGRHAFREKLKDRLPARGQRLRGAFRRFKALADRKKHVFDEDLEALVEDEVAVAGETIRIIGLTVIAGTNGPQKATLTLDVNGTEVPRRPPATARSMPSSTPSTRSCRTPRNCRSTRSMR